MILRPRGVTPPFHTHANPSSKVLGVGGNAPVGRGFSAHPRTTREPGRNPPVVRGGFCPDRAETDETPENQGIFLWHRLCNTTGPAGGNRWPSTPTHTQSRLQGRTIMFKLAAVASSVLISLGLAAVVQPPPPSYGPPPPKAKGKGEPKKKGAREPGGELRKAYDLLRRLRADDGVAGRPAERLREWTDRAAELYRDGLRAQSAGDLFRAREYGTAAHDLARAVDHSRNGTHFDRPDPGLPAPSDNFGLEDSRQRARRDLYRAYERIGWLGTWQDAPGSEVYIKAARDLYSAARRDLEAGRDERAGELARASEAMTHVPEHLAQVGADGAGPGSAPLLPPERPEPKAKKLEPRDPRSADLPPILPRE